jgi:peptidoglycan/xylan/chitin deacetylase (PgdA/CDA1 family)
MIRPPFRRIPVLVYHKIGIPPAGVRNSRSWVSPDRFAWQMRYLSKRGWRCITPEALAAHYRGEKPAGPKSILITFDDGSRSCYTEALPIMQSFGLTGTVFVVSGQLGGRALWDRNPDHPDDALLTIEEIRDLLGVGWSIGAHTMTHRRLTGLPAPEAREEIQRSRKQLEESLSVSVTVFAYPYGSYAPEHIGMVREAGYEIGFTTHYPEHGLSAVRRENIHGEVRRWRFLWRFARAKRGEFQDVET